MNEFFVGVKINLQNIRLVAVGDCNKEITWVGHSKPEIIIYIVKATIDSAQYIP